MKGIAQDSVHFGKGDVSERTSYPIEREYRIDSLDDLVDFVVSHHQDAAVGFRCAKVYPAVQPPPEILALVKQARGKATGIQKPDEPSMASFYVGTRLMSALASITRSAPISSLARTWSPPTMISALSNGIAYKAVVTDGAHSVTAAALAHDPRQIGIPANNGFSVLRTILLLDLVNMGRTGKVVPSASGLVFRAEGVDIDYPLLRDSEGRSIRLSAEHNGSLYSLSATNSSFLDEVRTGLTNCVLGIQFDDVYSIANPGTLFREVWAQLVPSTNTYISLIDGTNRHVYRAGSFDFTDRSKGTPLLAPPSAPAERNSIVLVVLLISFLGGLVALGIGVLMNRKPSRKGE